MSVILLDRDIVHYEVLGRGKPLIYLHGWVGSWRYWIPSMQASSTLCRAYALDFWGFGDTSKNSQFYSLDEQSNLLGQFIERMGIGRVALVGHGLGALVSMLYSLRNPQVVDRQVLIAYAWETGKVNPRLRTSSPSDLADWLLGKSSQNETARFDAPRSDPEAIKVSTGSLGHPDLLQARKILNVPTLYVYGQNDPIITAPDVDEDLRQLPETMHTIIFEDSGHFPMLDECSKLNRLLADFLALPGGESPRVLLLKDEWRRRVR